MLKEFREFALKGNLIDFAVGVIVGGAFGAIANSFVADLISPILGLILPAGSLKDQKIVLKAAEIIDGKETVPAATLNWGNFLQLCISFLIVAFVMFLVVKGMNSLKKKEEAVPAPPPEPTTSEKLLMEIRDSLKK
jgi:large conductance mechanosensitive channel